MWDANQLIIEENGSAGIELGGYPCNRAKRKDNRVDEVGLERIEADLDDGGWFRGWGLV